MKPRKHAELIKQWVDDDSLVIEIYIKSSGEWKRQSYPEWLDDYEYRIKPTKPSIDWSHVADEYKWLAIDENGEAAVYINKPNQITSRSCYWDNCTVGFAEVKHLKSFKRGTCDWKDSLVQRPEGE